MGQRFHFLPTALPDETLHSILSRYTRLSGLSGKLVFEGISGADAFSQNVAFPNHLDDLIDVLPHGTDLKVADIISRHTLLPYYQPFMSQQQSDEVCAMMAGHGNALMFRVGVIASRLVSSSRVRFCTTCVEHDLRNAGAAYWHRVHQLPGVLVCPHHGTVLSILDDAWSRNSRQLHLPDDDAVQVHSRLLTGASLSVSLLRTIAVRSLQLLNAGAVAVPVERLRAVFLGYGIDQGLASASGRLRLPLLARHLSDFFTALPQSWEYAVLHSAEAAGPASWVTKLLRKPRHSHHPLKFILLAQALGVPQEELLAVDASVPTHGSTSRGDRFSNPFPGAPLQTDKRRQCFEVEYRDRDAHECRDYAWLYRNDRNWLCEHISLNRRSRGSPEFPASRFRMLDGVLANRIVECAAALRNHPGKPVWVSRAQVGRLVHEQSRFEKQLDRLPQCAAALAAACETREQFHARRVKWAAAELRREGKSITPSSLFLKASIRPCQEGRSELVQSS
ncbi:TnsD family transposase [Pseudomonas cichorii]|nr:TnsD family transposase [Pseudomonas cichorii]MBX8596773.1 TnsD family transposase [Pseudomonas cichorii]